MGGQVTTTFRENCCCTGILPLFVMQILLLIFAVRNFIQKIYSLVYAKVQCQKSSTVQ